MAVSFAGKAVDELVAVSYTVVSIIAGALMNKKWKGVVFFSAGDIAAALKKKKPGGFLV